MLTWLDKSKNLLREACTEWGIPASLNATENYGGIFTRDAVMAGIVGILLEDEIIINGLVNTVKHLKELQGAQGQIPSNFHVKDGKVDKVSFGTLSPKIDSCTWYMIGTGLLIKEGFIKREDYEQSIEKVIHLLDGIEFNGKNLVYVPKGGNWADEYVYEGYILYDQALRTWGLALLADIYGNEEWHAKARAIKKTILASYESERTPYYNSSFFPGGVFDKFDLPAHTILGIILNKQEGTFDKTLTWVHESFLQQHKLPPVFHPIIDQEDPDWETLHNYHLYRFKNKPHHFHNGGIWWIWLGWLAVSFSLWNKTAALDQLVDEAFKFLDEHEANFEFEEYISADDYQPNGTKKLAFTASGIALISLAKSGYDFSELNPFINTSIKEDLEIKEEYLELPKQLIKRLKEDNLLTKEKLVIGVAGESGSGKSVTAKSLQIELAKLNIHSIILHQDGYYKLPPQENHNKRKEDISWVGVNELKLELMQQHIRHFLDKKPVLDIPSINYKLNTFTTNSTVISDTPVLIVEGVYSFFLKDLDYKVFMSRTYKDTLEKRKSRTREKYDPFVEKVLQIEHLLVSAKKESADSIVTKDYKLVL